jgi:hypothetical protein
VARIGASGNARMTAGAKRRTQTKANSSAGSPFSFSPLAAWMAGWIAQSVAQRVAQKKKARTKRAK